MSAAPAHILGPHYRIIASRYPPIDVFEDLGLTPEEARLAFALEALTNDRLQKPLSRLTRLPDEEIVLGPSAGYVMAAFLHTSETGGRFNTPDLGAWYAARDLDTAIEETRYHLYRRLALSDAGFPNTFEMRVLTGDMDLYLGDLRGQQASRPDLYDPDPSRYGPGQQIVEEMRRTKAGRGLVYDSVRRAGGECVCLIWPSAVALPIKQGDHLLYVFDDAGGFTHRTLHLD